MTVNDLKLELECYQLWINPECDVDNLSLEEWAEFISMYNEIKIQEDFKSAPILRFFK